MIWPRVSHIYMTRSFTQSRHLSPQTMWLVLERDGYQCFCCGESVIGQRYTIWRRNHTRGDSPENLITVLGTPSTGCMERLERGDPLDEAKGYVLKPAEDPERIPALRHGRTQVWLTPEGGYFPWGGNQPPRPRGPHRASP
jgi:DNA-directed RNA polymerase subunit N (RpoN/RPB10)